MRPGTGREGALGYVLERVLVVTAPPSFPTEPGGITELVRQRKFAIWEITPTGNVKRKLQQPYARNLQLHRARNPVRRLQLQGHT